MKIAREWDKLGSASHLSIRQALALLNEHSEDDPQEAEQTEDTEQGQESESTSENGDATAKQPKLTPEILALNLSPKFRRELEEERLPRGKQLDFARLCNDGVSARTALKQVLNQREPGDETVARNDRPSADDRAVSHSALEVFNIAKFKELLRLVRQLEQGIDELVRLPGGEDLWWCTRSFGDENKTVQRSEHLEALKKDLKHTRPHALCPYCAGKATPGCRGCSGAGWVTKITWDGAEDSIKERLR
jgi:hypothetical protein